MVGCDVAGPVGGIFDGIDEVGQANFVGRRQDGVGVGGVGTVETDDDVEVHDASTLHFGNLAVGEPDPVAGRCLGFSPYGGWHGQVRCGSAATARQPHG